MSNRSINSTSDLPDLGFDPVDQDQLIWIRVLATTDIHAELRDFDYARNRADPNKGLSRAGGLIAGLRRSAPASLLLDNGDFLFGRPFSELPDRGAAAVIESMIRLGYDAVNLGNHELDLGFDTLVGAVNGTELSVVSASFLGPDGAPVFPVGRIVERAIPVASDRRAVVRIGITGVLPPRCLGPSTALGAANIRLADPEEALLAAAAHLREQGAQIVVLLCHEGLSTEDGEDLPQRLAKSGEIDALVLGHTHETFPGPAWTGLPGVDPEAGTVHGIPAVMPGSWANQVGRIDLGLASDPVLGFRVVAHDVGLHAVNPPNADRPPNAPAVLTASQGAHAAMLRTYQEPVVNTDRSLFTFFAQLGYCPSTRMCAAAIARAVAQAVPDKTRGSLPIVGLAAPFMCGGYRGPGDYVEIRPGPISRGELRRMSPHSDLVIGIPGTGRDLRFWLERSMSAFHQILPGEHAVELIDAGFPPSDFDVPFGVQFTLDISSPAMCTSRGMATGEAPGRVQDLHIDGQPVTDDMPLIIATTTHRSGGGGRFPIPQTDAAVVTDVSIADALVDALAAGVYPATGRMFNFAPLPHTRAVFSTGPRAMAYIPDDARTRLKPLGVGRDGFLKMLLNLSAG